MSVLFVCYGRKKAAMFMHRVRQGNEAGMTPFYADDWLTIYEGDCRAVLAELPSDSVDCVVTSPPYWGLRDYGTAAWIGGNAECDHVERVELQRDSTDPSKGNYIGTRGTQPAKRRTFYFDKTCDKCGAIRQDSQLGLERTPEEYVANMVAVFREVRRVLKPSGTCWLNLGDSYSQGGYAGDDAPANAKRIAEGSGMDGKFRFSPRVQERQGGTKRQRKASDIGLKPKDLVGIPWRVAFALQADGWYLRSDIIWSKPNPMPESVIDRPTKSHEYLFLLTKSARYYFDADAVREPVAESTLRIHASEGVQSRAGEWKSEHVGNGHSGLSNGASRDLSGRNIRSVWTIATRPYPGAHFAVFPPELPERCIKAGSSEKGVCPECGSAWERVVERTPMMVPERARSNRVGVEATTRVNDGERRRAMNGQEWAKSARSETTGWRPTCRCAHESSGWVPVPAVILDPFAGSGTVGLVANRLSRRAILIDLNPEYLKQQMKRNAQTPLGLSEGVA